MSGAGQEEDKKPADQSAHINLKVKGQDGNEVFFRIKRSTRLKKPVNPTARLTNPSRSATAPLPTVSGTAPALAGSMCCGW